MTARPAGSLLNYLEQVPDPRGRQGQRYSFAAMLAASICAILSGFPGYTAMAQWIHLQEDSLWHLLGFTRRPPEHDCFRDVLMAVDPQALSEALMLWITEGLGMEIGDEELQAIVIDGKVLRGTRKKHQRTYQALALLDQKTGFALSETPVDPTTNEAKTGLALLKEMVLEGKIIVGDAAYCDQEICKEIVDSGGDYLVLVKDNQPTLHHAAQQSFVVPRSFSPLRQEESLCGA
ncbi:MAG: ISAs1 family transposase [Planctomycetaceae bacterium]|nr:ISAs1 family transposase [Planctomycetaceae bacterium]